MRKLTKVRKEHNTGGADPTIMVTWTVTDKSTNEWIEVTEFQQVYKGLYRMGTAAGGIKREIGTMEAQLIHEGLESEYAYDRLQAFMQEEEDMETDR